MKKWTFALGALVVLFAAADLIHGQHNGDVHRFYIHIAEFASFLCFLALLEILAFKLIVQRFGLRRWLTAICLSITSFFAGFLLFGLSGGSAHGDGGPLAVGFALIGLVGALGIPISILGLIVSTIIRRRRLAAAA